MAVKNRAGRRFASTLAGGLLASFVMSAADAKPYSSFDQPYAVAPDTSQTPDTPFALRGVRPPPQRSYVQTPVRSPAFTQVQQGIDMPATAETAAGAATPTPPRVVRRISDEEAYAPLGIRRGSFILRPSVETAAGFDSNVNATPGNARSSGYTRIKPDFILESDWSNHAFRLHLGAERFDYFSDDLAARNNLNLDASTRIDIRRGTTAEFGAAYIRAQDSNSLTTTSLPGNAVSQPDVQSFRANGALSQKLGIFGVRVSGESTQRSYSDTELSTGATIDNGDRNVRDSVFALRGSYEWTGAVQPFVETAYNRHDYDIEKDAGGFDKGSNGVTERAGLMFDFGPFLSGEIAAGLLYQTPYEQSAESYSGVTFDSALNWSPTALTTFRFGARTAVLDDVGVGTIGGLSHDATARAEHKLRRNVLVGASLGLGYDSYEGIDRDDLRFSAGVDAAWQLNRFAAVTGKIEHRTLSSSVAGEDTSGTLGELGLKLQY